MAVEIRLAAEQDIPLLKALILQSVRALSEGYYTAARRDGFPRMELAATLPGEPLYAALGYAVVRRFEVAMADGEVLPVAQMAKVLS